MKNGFTYLTTQEIESGIVQLTLDMPGRGANILDQTLFAELDRCMEQLSQRGELVGVILVSAKPSIFIAGADLGLISESLDWPEKEIVKFCEKGRAVMARFSRCPFVSVAAIHGACVGGGLELALWCDHRVATDDRKTQLGLPEVKLGLVPGWAGTARLPRLIGFEPAAELIITGRLINASESQKLGFVDEVTASMDLIPTAIKVARQSKASETFISRRRAIMGPVKMLDSRVEFDWANPSNLQSDLKSDGVEDEVQATWAPPLVEPVRRLGKLIVEQAEIYPYAPTVALEHLSRTANCSQADAWKSESLAIAQVWGSPANRGLLNHFFLIDRNKKQPGLVDMSIATKKIDIVGIIGAGVMGRSISENCLKRGLSVLLYDAAAKHANSVSAELLERFARPGTNLAIKSLSDYSELQQADLVIESVVENEEIKRKVLEQIEQSVSHDVIIASNTSSIPISRLARALSRPERFCGIHFCHPELMALVEVVCGQATAENTVAAAVGFVRQIGKIPVAMNDGPGFVVNRVLAAMLNSAIELLLQGFEAETIDSAIREFGFLGGPFEIIDTIGVDTCVYAGRTMWDAGLTCVSPSPLLPKLIKLGRLGCKTKAGIYQYPTPNRRGVSDPDFDRIVSSYRQSKDASGNLDPEELNERITRKILTAMLVESSKILEEDIIDDPRDLDLCIIHGLAFPQHRGGLLFWSDSVGLSKNVSRDGKNFL